MPRSYVMDHDAETIKRSIVRSDRTSLRLVHHPTDDDGEPWPWPWAVTDGNNFGWFEDDMILFWGINDERHILHELSKLGIYVLWS